MDDDLKGFPLKATIPGAVTARQLIEALRRGIRADKANQQEVSASQSASPIQKSSLGQQQLFPQDSALTDE